MLSLKKGRCETGRTRQARAGGGHGVKTSSRKGSGVLENNSDISVAGKRGTSVSRSWVKATQCAHSCPLRKKSPHISAPHPKTERSWGQTPGKRGSSALPALVQPQSSAEPLSHQEGGFSFTPTLQNAPTASKPAAWLILACPQGHQPPVPPQPHGEQSWQQQDPLPLPPPPLPAPLPISLQRLETGEEFKVITITF